MKNIELSPVTAAVNYITSDYNVMEFFRYTTYINVLLHFLLFVQ